jgi:nitrate reductase NapE component
MLLFLFLVLPSIHPILAIVVVVGAYLLLGWRVKTLKVTKASLIVTFKK